MDFRLYINGQECDIDNTFAVQIDYTSEDTESPSAVLTEYSKTVNLPRTGNNDLIFNFLGNLDRRYEDEQGYFNQLYRTPMLLTWNGSTVMKGYAKVENVTSSAYSVTLYSGVAGFFYTFKTTEDGEDYTLDRLHWPTTIDFRINKEIVQKAWQRLTASVKEGITAWDVINFAPCYNGVPSDIDAGKALINIDGSSVFTASTITEGSSSYTTYNNSKLALATLDSEVSEWEINDLRSYMQRPVFSMKALFETVKRVADEEFGFKLDLDRGFFNDDNPYYTKAWVTLPLLSSLETDGEETTGKTTYVQSIDFQPKTLFEQGVQFTGGLGTGAILSMPQENGKSNLNIKFSLSADIDYQGDTLYTGSLNHAYNSDRNPENIGESATQYNNKGVAVQFYFTDEVQGIIIAASPVYALSTMISGRTESYESPIGYNTARESVIGTWKYSGGQWMFTGSGGNTEFDAVIADVPRVDRMYLTMAVYSYSERAYKRNEYWLDTMENGLKINSFKATVSSGDITYTTYGKTGTNSRINERKLFSNGKTVTDYLVSYSKMFGLKWLQEGDTIHLMTRNRYYQGQMNDAEGDISDITATPLMMSKRYYDLKNDMDDTDLKEKYEKDWSADYGRQRIDTNYRFNSDVNGFFSDMAFNGAIYGKEKSNYFRHVKGKNWSLNNMEWLPAPILDKLSYSLILNGNDPENTKDVDIALDVVKYVNYNGSPRYDCMDRLCFQNGSDGTDGSDVLVFYDGIKDCTDANGYSVVYNLTDDLDEMWALNGESATWIYTNSAKDANGRTISIRYAYLPNFSRYYTEGTNSIVLSMDFGQPRELYCDLQGNESSTIYTRFWKNYLKDRLDINTGKIKLPMLFRTGMDAYTLREFVEIDSHRYCINSASYNVGTTGTTTAELVRIQDAWNYTNGQTLIYPSAELSLNGDVPTVGFTGGSLELSITETDVDNVEWHTDVEWITLSRNGNTLKINVLPNEGDERVYHVWLTGRDVGGKDVTGNIIEGVQEREIKETIMSYTTTDGNAWECNYLKAYDANGNEVEARIKDATGWTWDGITSISYKTSTEDFPFNLLTFNGFNKKIKIKNAYSFFILEENMISAVLSNMDTSDATDMRLMFEDCSSLRSIDLTGLDTSNVWETQGMFAGCTSLTSLDLSSFNTSNVCNMGTMFTDCTSLVSLSLLNWNTSNVTEMDSMFYNCSALTSLDLSNFDTSKLEYMTWMFAFCKSLISLDLSNFKVSNVNDMSDMFYAATALVSLDLSNWELKTTAKVGYMFKYCSSLKTIYMRNCSEDTVSKIRTQIQRDGLTGVEIITE